MRVLDSLVLEDVKRYPKASIREVLVRHTDWNARFVHEAIRRLRMQRMVQGVWDRTGARSQRRWTVK